MQQKLTEYRTLIEAYLKLPHDRGSMLGPDN